ncbi:MAG: hypothetical protein FWB72_01120 [Firmicutes bacterium]|nr:hypothetical protein [Bacillota bacterium]
MLENLLIGCAGSKELEIGAKEFQVKAEEFEICDRACGVESKEIKVSKQIKEISEDSEMQEKFNRLLKIGVYKELHKKGLLSDSQLSALVHMQNKPLRIYS